MSWFTPCEVVNARLAHFMLEGSTAEGALLHFLNELHVQWMAAERKVPTGIGDNDRCLLDLASALFTNVQGAPTFAHALQPERTRATFWALQGMFLRSEVGTALAGRVSVINAVRYQILQTVRAFQRDQILWSRFSEWRYDSYIAAAKF